MDFVLKASDCHEQNSKAKLTSQGVFSVALCIVKILALTF